MEAFEKRVLIVSVILLLFFLAALVFAYQAYGIRIPGCVTDVRPFTEGKVIRRGERDFEVQMVAKMWAFEPKEVTLPPGSKVALYLSTADVVHGMQILGTNVNLMAVPGAVNFAEFTFKNEGEFAVVCHEYCGRNHQSMAGKFIIRAGASEPPAPSPAAPPSDDAKLFDQYLCTSCHSLDGSGEDTAPSLRGLFRKSRKLADGTTVIADEAYLRESILHPDKQVVKGYDPMPEADAIPEADLRKLLDAIERLAE